MRSICTRGSLPKFEDNALLNVFGQHGLGLFVTPSVIATEVQRQYQVKIVGQHGQCARTFLCHISRPQASPSLPCWRFPKALAPGYLID